MVLLLVAGCHESPASVTDAPLPIVPPFASGLIEESVEVAGHSDPSAMGAMALIMSYRERLNRDPQDLDALILLANANYDIQRYQEAELLYRQALAIDPTIINVRTDLATALHRQGRSKEAIEELQRVLVVDYKHENALFNLGLLKLAVLNDREGAITVWEQLAGYTENPRLKAEVEGMIARARKAPPPGKK
jgi:tetratricopeptide (TPR) repeat protein